MSSFAASLKPPDRGLATRLAEKLASRRAEQAAVIEAHRAEVEAARDDALAFSSFVGTDDETGDPFTNSWFHVKLQEDWSAFSRLVTHAQAGAGKTSQLVMRLLWELGRNRRLRVLYLSAEVGLGVEAGDNLRKQIEENHRLHAVFPDLRPGGQWGATRWSVAGQRGNTPTFTPAGMFSKKLGRRYDLIVVDDPHDKTTAATAHQRKRVISQLDQQWFSRLSTQTRIWILSNAWHKDDAPHTIARRDAFEHRVYPASAGLDPERWPEERLNEALETMGRLAYDRMMECKAVSAETEVIREADVRACVQPGLTFQPDSLHLSPRGRPYRDEDGDFVRFERVAIGIDPANVGDDGSGEGHDEYAIHVAGTDPITGKIQTLHIETGHLATPELLDRICLLHVAYEPDLGFWVETDGQQKHLIDMARDHLTMAARAERLGLDEEDILELRISAHRTAGSKLDENTGIPSLSVDFASRSWLLPDGSQEPEVEKLVEGLVGFAFDGKHTDDTVIAAWIARKAIRAARTPRITRA